MTSSGPSGFDFTGLQKVQDPDRPLNRLVFSRLRAFEAHARMDGISIKYVLSGEEVYQVGKATYRVGPGQFLLVNHGREVSVCIPPGPPSAGICIYLEPHWYSGAVEAAGHPPDKWLEPQAARSVAECREGVYHSGYSPIGSSLHSLANWNGKTEHSGNWPDPFLTIARALGLHEGRLRDQEEAIPASRPATRKELSRRVNYSLNLLHDQLDQPLRVADLAWEACMSEFHFLRTFKACTGMSPLQYLQRLRMERARELLTKSRLPIQQVALRCGFTDVQYFSRCFKRFAGCPPSEFRASGR